MGLKEPIQRIILLTEVTILENLNIRNLLVLIQAETKILKLYKIFKNFVKKGRPLGGFECSKSHFGQQLLLQREIPMSWGTTIDSFDSRNQSFPICNRNKMSNTKGSDLVPYSGRLK